MGAKLLGATSRMFSTSLYQPFHGAEFDGYVQSGKNFNGSMPKLLGIFAAHIFRVSFAREFDLVKDRSK